MCGHAVKSFTCYCHFILQFDTCVTARSVIGKWKASSLEVCSGHSKCMSVKSSRVWGQQPLLKTMSKHVLPAALLTHPRSERDKIQVPSSERIQANKSSYIRQAARVYKREHHSGAKQTVKRTAKVLSLTWAYVLWPLVLNAVFSFVIVICMLCVIWDKHTSLHIAGAKWVFSYGKSENI